jgi:hypothetical protein
MPYGYQELQTDLTEAKEALMQSTGAELRLIDQN